MSKKKEEAVQFPDSMRERAGLAVLLTFSQMPLWIRIMGLWWLIIFIAPFPGMRFSLWAAEHGHTSFAGFIGMMGAFLIMSLPLAAYGARMHRAFFLGEKAPRFAAPIDGRALAYWGQDLFLSFSFLLVLAAIYGGSLILTPVHPLLPKAFFIVALLFLMMGFLRATLLLPAAAEGARGWAPETMLAATRGQGCKLFFGAVLACVPAAIGLMAIRAWMLSLATADVADGSRLYFSDQVILMVLAGQFIMVFGFTALMLFLGMCYRAGPGKPGAAG